MSRILKGSEAELRYRGSRIAKCRDWSISATKDIIETTCIGDLEKTYEGSLFSATGTMTVLYDLEDPGTVQLMQSLFDGEQTDPVELSLVINKQFNKYLNIQAIITSGAVSAASNEVISASVSFTVTGKVLAEV